jgi:periplasmic divalent cation tolerance protein
MSTNPDQPIMVFMTAGSVDEANRLADMLVDKRLAACVQIMREMNSVFRWQEKVETQREVLLIAKTLSSKFAEIEREVIKLHSYETPEIVAVSLSAGSGPYFEWLRANVSEQGQGGG